MGTSCNSASHHFVNSFFIFFLQNCTLFFFMANVTCTSRLISLSLSRPNQTRSLAVDHAYVQYGCNVNTRVQDLKADPRVDTFTHTHTNWSITQSDKQDKNPIEFISENFVNRFQGSVMYFLFVCHGFTLRNVVYVFVLCLLVEGWRDDKPDDTQSLCCVSTAHGCDSRGRSHDGNQCWLMLKYTLFPPRNCPISCLSFPAWLPSTSQGLSLRHRRHQSSSPSD